MNGNEWNNKISDLTFHQQSALPSVVVAPSIAGAARKTGVAESTLLRWLEEPAFRKKLDLAHKETYDLALPARSQIGQPPPKSAEMNGNEWNSKISDLTFRQQSALPSVVVASSIAGAARKTGVAESTLRRWLEEPAFREELDRRQAKPSQLYRMKSCR